MVFFATPFDSVIPVAKILVFSKMIAQIDSVVEIDLWDVPKQKGCLRKATFDSGHVVLGCF